MHVPAWQKGKNTGRRRKQTSKQTAKRNIFRASKKYIYNNNNNNNNNSNSKTLHLQSLYLISIFRNQELLNCCKLYVHREQSVACSIEESVETSGYDLETFTLKKIGVCVCVCVWGGGEVGGGVSVSFGGLLYARVWVCLRNCFNRKCFGML